MYLFFDTETTGLPDFNAPSDAPHQPKIIQLAALLTDGEGKAINQFCTLVRLPDDVEVGEIALKTHGISKEMASSYGLPAASALRLLERMMSMAEVAIGHNVSFDDRMLRIHTKGDDTFNFEKPRKCTMTMAAPIVNLPPTEKMLAAGFSKPKSPNLQEAYQFFFGKPFDGAHDAMSDVLACRDIFFKMQEPKKEAA